jgi:hypothetical protein
VKTVFISYRRQDTAPAAGRVYDRLGRLLSKRHVFFDVDTIAGGKDFVTEMTEAVRKSDVVLLFIGKRWLDPEGAPRICEPEDHVRAEVRVALQSAPVLLPVLVDGAAMPRADLLPEDIRGITTKNALPLRHETFDDDAENILATIMGGGRKQRSWDDQGKLGVKIGYAVAGVVAALALWIVAGLVYFWALGQFLAETIGNAANVVLLCGLVVGGALLGFLYEAKRRKRRFHELA